jgi:hypothetical protein
MAHGRMIGHNRYESWTHSISLHVPSKEYLSEAFEGYTNVAGKGFDSFLDGCRIFN